MAGFFDNVKKSINKATQTVGANASSMIEVNKLKSEMTAATREKKVIFSEIGESVYNMKKEGNVDLGQVDVLLEKIFDLDSKIAGLEEQIEKVNQEKDEKLSSLEEAEVVATTVEPVAEPVVQPVVEPVVEVVEEIKSEVSDNDMSGDSETGEYKG